MSDFPFCTAAGLEITELTAKTSKDWTVSLVVSARDVEAFLKHLELAEFNYVGGKYFYVQPDKFNALKNASKGDDPMPKMSEKYRLVTDGLKYRILMRSKFLWFTWWSPSTDMYGCPYDYYSKDEAKRILEALIEEEKAQARGWSDVD